jgi:hypothetical protein
MKLFINCDDNKVTLNKKNYLLKAAERLGLRDKVVGLTERVDDEPTDFMLNIEPCGFKEGNKWTGIWEIDILLDRVQMSDSNWAVCDTVFMASSNIPDRLKDKYPEKRVVMFQACDPLLHRRVESVKKEFDFVFAGSIGGGIYKAREKAMETLRDHFTFKGYGKEHKPEQYVKMLSSARVQFIRSGSSPIAESQTAQRLFECLAIGPVLKDYHPDLELLGIEEGVDYFSYKDDNEMIEKMQVLLDNPDFADEMARNGRRKALMFHTYEHRLLSILNLVDEFVPGSTS